MRKKRINRLFVISMILLFISASFFFYIVLGRNTKEYDTTSPGAQVRDVIKDKFPGLRVISGGFRFDSVEKINFIPKKIGNYIFENDDKILEDAKKIYPDYEAADLKKFVIRLMTTWTSLRELFSGSQSIEGVELQPTQDEIKFSQIDRELPGLTQAYEANKTIINGFFLKVRFSGVFNENIEKLGLTENELKSTAQKILNDYMESAKGLQDPSGILPTFNADEKVMLLNNGETSESFEEYDLYPPFFDDPDFYKMVANLPVGEFSPVYILKTANPLQKDIEEYAFASFYLKDKKGQYLPLNELIRQFLVENRVR